MAKQLWPADKVERRPIDKLVPYARNSRTHSEEQVAQIAASMREWGWTNPVLVDEDGGIIAGHGRLLAARKLGLEEVPVMVANGWSEAQKRAYIIADNKLAENAGWDDDLLKVEFEELQELGFDLTQTGFTAEEIDGVLDGWSGDIAAVERHEENLDGIRDKVTVHLDGTYKSEVVEVIETYCREHEIEVEIS